MDRSDHVASLGMQRLRDLGGQAPVSAHVEDAQHLELIHGEPLGQALGRLIPPALVDQADHGEDLHRRVINRLDGHPTVPSFSNQNGGGSPARAAG
ncbi:hypothetical protein LJR219_005194 [Phenylobacterium sp. LjRoot219]|uniref:hypothetical protein n=1 Tax=Phenylobacterium sp. LjRoot219 TaxID=3342283 RepID=UPI003ECD756C